MRCHKVQRRTIQVTISFVVVVPEAEEDPWAAVQRCAYLHDRTPCRANVSAWHSDHHSNIIGQKATWEY